MSNKEIKDRLSDGEGAPDERTDMEEQIDAVMDRLTDPPDDEEDLDDLGEYDDSKESLIITNPTGTSPVMKAVKNVGKNT